MEIAIIGSGLYGMSMARLLASNGNKIILWTEKKDISSIIAPDNITITNDLKACVCEASIVFVLTAAKYTKEIFKNIKDYLSTDAIIILGSKGILENNQLIEEALIEELPNINYAIISGPTFAIDIAALEPVGFTLATKSKETFNKIKSILKSVKLEYTPDTIGTELCGVLKNAYAIGSGILECFHFGPSFRCLYITSVINEMKSILKQNKNDENTVNLLCGIGDLVLTCTSTNSRNFTFGSIIGLGNKEEIIKYLENNTVEGNENLKILLKKFKEKSIEAPILTMISDIINNDRNLNDIIDLVLQ